MPDSAQTEYDVLRELFEKAPLPYQSLDRNRRVCRVNDAWLELLGYERSEVLGLPFSDFLTDQYGVLLAHRFEKFVATGRVRGVEFDLQRKDGRVVSILLDGQVVTDADGNFQRTHCILVDVTDMRRVEQKFLDARKMESLGVMAGGIAHDFNNLLQAIQGNAELARYCAGGDPELLTSLDAIHAACQQAAALCRQMLACAGKGEHVVDEVQPGELVSGMSGLLRAALTRKAALELVVDEDLPALTADPVRLRQVLLNLVANAAEAVGDHPGTVTVAATSRTLGAADLVSIFPADELRPGRYVVLSVQDDGCGMEPAVLASVFDPFFTTKFTGRGLGLAVVRGVARAHGGRVLVTSQPGKGTTVAVYLPAAAGGLTPAKTVAAAPTTVSDDSYGCALIADDEPAVLAVAVRMCERLGWRTVTAADGAETIMTLATSPETFDVVVLDWSMPVMDGCEALERIRDMAPGLPVIIASGHAATLAGEQGIEPEAFLEKPYVMEQMRAVLAAYGRRD